MKRRKGLSVSRIIAFIAVVLLLILLWPLIYIVLSSVDWSSREDLKEVKSYVASAKDFISENETELDILIHLQERIRNYNATVPERDKLLNCTVSTINGELIINFNHRGNDVTQENGQIPELLSGEEKEALSELLETSQSESIFISSKLTTLTVKYVQNTILKIRSPAIELPVEKNFLYGTYHYAEAVTGVWGIELQRDRWRPL